MKKIKGIVEQCKCAGKRIKKGEIAEVEDKDAFLLVGMKMCEYVEEKDVPKKKAGLSTKDSALVGKKSK